MSWEDALFTILGDFMATLGGILVEWWREERKLREKHFEDIKEMCLDPLLQKLDDLKREFVFGESGPRWSSLEIEELHNSDVRWWELFSFKSTCGINPLLYEDLKNHYVELYKELQELEWLIKAKYAMYLRAALKLLEVIESDPEFKAFEKLFEKAYGDKMSSYPRYTVVFLALGVDKSYWPNIYSYIKRELDKALRLGNKFYNSIEVQEVRDMAREFKSKIDKCIQKIEEIVLKAELRGKCRYTGRWSRPSYLLKRSHLRRATML